MQGWGIVVLIALGMMVATVLAMMAQLAIASWSFARLSRHRGPRLRPPVDDGEHMHHSFAALAQSEFVAEVREQMHRAEEAALRFQCCPEAAPLSVVGRREWGWVCPVHGTTEPPAWKEPVP